MKKQVSKKTMAMASKSGGVSDSHSSSSSSSNGGVSTNGSGGISGATKGQDIPKKSKWSQNKSNTPGKHNYKQHLYKSAQKCSAPSYNANVIDDVFIDKDEDLVDEFDGFRITRKTNLSHLLNFRYTDSSAFERNYGNSHSRGSQFGWHSGKYKSQKVYDKYQFIQANCKFVVDDGFCDVLSPDQFIDWDKIVQVQLLAPNMPYCPICLEGSPTAPRITKCGHVYCFPCVLQLISLSDNKWAKCPICYDAVSEVDLRDVKCLNKKLYKIGDTITLNLMTRNRNSLKVERFSRNGTESDNNVNRLNKCDVEMDLEKVSKYDWQQQITLIHEPALRSLKLRKQDFNEEEEDKFIGLALMKIQEVIKTLEESSSNKQELIEFEAVDSGISQDLIKSVARDGTETEDNRGGGSNAPDRYYFYQSSDGQLIYANSFNVRCMIKEYGNLECGLETVSGQIVDLTETRVDDFFRSKFRFLAHLPLSTVVTFAELDLRPPTLSKQTLKHFADEMRRRREEKDKKRKEERKRDNRINREMQRKMGGYLGHSNAFMDYEDDEEDVLFERIGLGEENFPSFSSNGQTGDTSKEPGCNDGSKERKNSSGIGHENGDFDRNNTVDELGSRPGAQFTSFANVLMTTCASPTYRNTNFSVWGSPTGDAAVTSSSSLGWGTHKPPADVLAPSLSYAQRLNMVEKNDEELRSVAKFAESEDVDIELPAPSFNESFSVAFEKALYKQGGQKSKKKKKAGNKVSLDKFNAQE